MAEQQLFRANAVKQQSARLDGEVIIAQPLSSSLLTVILLGIVLAIALFLSVTSFNRKETVNGYLKPDIGLAKVVSARAGVLQQLYVDDGEQVQAGDKLALLVIPEHLAAGHSLTGTLFQGLVQQTELVNLRKQQLQSQFSQQEAEYNARLALSHNLLNDIKAQQQLLQQRLQLNQQRFNNFKGLSQQGAISTNELQQQQELVLNIQQQLAELNASEQNQKAQLAQLEGSLQRLPSEQQQQLALLDSDISRLKQQQTELNARGELLITAPISGRVTNVFLNYIICFVAECCVPMFGNSGGFMQDKIILICNFFISLWILILSIISIHYVGLGWPLKFTLILLTALSISLVNSNVADGLGKFSFKVALLSLFIGISSDLLFSIVNDSDFKFKFAVAWACLLVIIIKFERFWDAATRR